MWQISGMGSSPAELKTEPAPPLDQEEGQPEKHAVRSWRHQLPRALMITSAVSALALVVVFVNDRTETSSIRGVALSSDTRSAQNKMIRLKGTTEAVHTRTIIAPLLAGEHVGTLTITTLAPSGSRVKRGDLLAEFDRQAQTRECIDKQSEYEKLVNQALEEQAKESAARAKDETEIRQAESNLSKAELEMQKVEIVSRIDAEKAQEDLDEAKATLQQLRETFDLKRKAAQAGIRILEIQRDRAQQVMQHAQANAELMQIRSPIDGVVVPNTLWKQGKMGEVQEGDQIRPGVSFMQVVDPSLMQVRVLANQGDFLDLQIGRLATVRLDAYPELIFPARLEEVAPIGRNGDFSSKLRTFAVIFSITGNDAKLMPDLSAAVDVDQTKQGGTAGAFQ